MGVAGKIVAWALRVFASATTFLGGSWIVPVVIAGSVAAGWMYLNHSIRSHEALRIQSVSATHALEVQNEQFADMLAVQQTEIASLKRRQEERSKSAAARDEVIRSLPRESGTRLSDQEVAALRAMLGKEGRK